MADVFVSYARTDAAVAELIVNALTAAGWSVWWDPTIVPGDRWGETIKTEIEAAGAVVVIWTGTSISSNWVLEEAGFARDRGKLVPVAIGIEPPFGFRQIQTVRLAAADTGFSPENGELFLKGIEQAIRRPLPLARRRLATARLMDALSVARTLPRLTVRRVTAAIYSLIGKPFIWLATAARSVGSWLRRRPLISLIAVPIVALFAIEKLNEHCVFCAVHQIRIAAGGFNPPRLRICQGDLVAFTNETAAAADVAVVAPGLVVPSPNGGPLRLTPKTFATKAITINSGETYRIRLEALAGPTFLDRRTVDLGLKGTWHSLQLIEVRCN